MGKDSHMFNKLFSDRVRASADNWELFENITNTFRCVVIVGAGNHYDVTPTMGRIAQSDLDSESVRIIRPHFNYFLVPDREFERMLKKPGYPFYRQIFKDEITFDNVAFYAGYPNRYQVKRSFAGAFGSALRLDYKNLTASRVRSLSDEPLTDQYRQLLVSLNEETQVPYHHDFDFGYKFPESELRAKFPGHLKNDFPSNVIIHPLEFFYKTFDRPNLRWLNLNQDGLLEKNISRDRVVSYHENVQECESNLVLPGATGPVNWLAEQRALRFVHQAQVVIALGYSFSDYDYDILEMIDGSKISHFLIFDINSEKVRKNLKAYFPKATIVDRHSSLPLFPEWAHYSVKERRLVQFMEI